MLFLLLLLCLLIFQELEIYGLEVKVAQLLSQTNFILILTAFWLRNNSVELSIPMSYAEIAESPLKIENYYTSTQTIATLTQHKNYVKML